MLQFKSNHCHQYCTQTAVFLFLIIYDNFILKFGSDSQWIGVIGSMCVSSANETEIDWVDVIPGQYRDFQMLYSGETANALASH
jgi:hypothetical protein